MKRLEEQNTQVLRAIIIKRGITSEFKWGDIPCLAWHANVVAGCGCRKCLLSWRDSMMAGWSNKNKAQFPPLWNPKCQDCTEIAKWMRSCVDGIMKIGTNVCFFHTTSYGSNNYRTLKSYVGAGITMCAKPSPEKERSKSNVVGEGKMIELRAIKVMRSTWKSKGGDSNTFQIVLPLLAIYQKSPNLQE